MDYPFGAVLRSYNAGDVNDKYKFTEKERDVETGLDYFGARYYDPVLGIWLSVNPLWEKTCTEFIEVYPGWSPYNYVLNNPLKFIDPDGRYTAETMDGSPVTKDEDEITDNEGGGDEKKKKVNERKIDATEVVTNAIIDFGNTISRGVAEVKEVVGNVSKEIFENGPTVLDQISDAITMTGYSIAFTTAIYGGPKATGSTLAITNAVTTPLDIASFSLKAVKAINNSTVENWTNVGTHALYNFTILQVGKGIIKASELVDVKTLTRLLPYYPVRGFGGF